MFHRVASIIWSLVLVRNVVGLFEACPALLDLTGHFKDLMSQGQETRTLTYSSQMLLGQLAKKDDLISLEGRMQGLCLSGFQAGFPTLASDSKDSKEELRRVVTLVDDIKRGMAAVSATLSALPGIIPALDDNKRDIAALSTTLNALPGIISALLDGKERNQERREVESARTTLLLHQATHEATHAAVKQLFVDHSYLGTGQSYMAAGAAAAMATTSIKADLDTQKQDVRFFLETNSAEVKSGIEGWRVWGATCAAIFCVGVFLALCFALYFQTFHSSQSAAAPKVVSQSPVPAMNGIEMERRIKKIEQTFPKGLDAAGQLGAVRRSEAATAKEAARVQEEIMAAIKHIKDEIEKMKITSPETAAAATQELKIDHLIEMAASGEVAATGQEILSKLDEVFQKLSIQNAEAKDHPSSTSMTTCMALGFLQTDTRKTWELIASARDEHAASLKQLSDQLESVGRRVTQTIMSVLPPFGEVPGVEMAGASSAESHTATQSQEIIEAKRPSVCDKLKETWKNAVSHHASSSKDDAGSHHASSSKDASSSSSSSHSP